MGTNKSKLGIGLLLVVLGIYFIFNRFFGLKFINLVLFVSAGSFILLYFTKKKVWSLILGIVFSVIWLLRVFPNFDGSILPALIFILAGIAFMLVYFSGLKIQFLITGSVLTWLGLFLVLSKLSLFGGKTVALFFICMSLAFLTMYVFNHIEMGKWTLFPMIIFMLFGILLYTGIQMPFRFIFGSLPVVMAAILIFVGLVIILKGIKKK